MFSEKNSESYKYSTELYSQYSKLIEQRILTHLYLYKNNNCVFMNQVYNMQFSENGESGVHPKDQ